MDNNVIDAITKELALKNNYSLNKASILTNSIFKAMKDNIQSNNLDIISLMYIGKFRPNNKSKKKQDELSKEDKTDN